MNLKYFGDSYDIVKKSLIGWLHVFGPWSAHPMFTEDVSPEDAQKFSRFLHADILSAERLTSSTDRTLYFSPCREAENLFLDPDTGVRIPRCGGNRAVKYVFGAELLELSCLRPNALTLVFDQSHSRGRQDSNIQEKLQYLEDNNVHGFAYASHAPFLLVSANSTLIKRARKTLIEVSGLPPERLVPLKQ